MRVGRPGVAADTSTTHTASSSYRLVSVDRWALYCTTVQYACLVRVEQRHVVRTRAPRRGGHARGFSFGLGACAGSRDVTQRLERGKETRGGASGARASMGQGCSRMGALGDGSGERTSPAVPESLDRPVIHYICNRYTTPAHHCTARCVALGIASRLTSPAGGSGTSATRAPRLCQSPAWKPPRRARRQPRQRRRRRRARGHDAARGP